MEDFRFHEGKLPSAYRYNFEQSLFQTEGYRQLQSSTGWISFYVLNERDLLVEAHIHFHVKATVAKSIIQSPFGGIEFSNKLSRKTLFQFIEFFSARLKAMDCESIVVVNPPLAYNFAHQSIIDTFMFNAGFSVLTAEVGSVITVSERSFEEILHPRKKRKLAQSSEETLRFTMLEADALDEVYNFIECHRKEKAYRLSVSLEHLRTSVERLGDAYTLFGVYHNSNLVAASVAVRVSKGVLYHFISEHIRKIGEMRPALILMRGIYRYCREHGIALLDLGTSATEGMPNFKLIKFKSELGGVSTTKLTLAKKLM